MPSLFDSHDEFNEWFSKDIENAAENKGSKLNEHQLRRLHMILKPFMLRRVKRHVQNELSEKVRVSFPLNLSKTLKVCRLKLIYMWTWVQGNVHFTLGFWPMCRSQIFSRKLPISEMPIQRVRSWIWSCSSAKSVSSLSRLCERLIIDDICRCAITLNCLKGQTLSHLSLLRTSLDPAPSWGKETSCYCHIRHETPSNIPFLYFSIKTVVFWMSLRNCHLLREIPA